MNAPTPLPKDLPREVAERTPQPGFDAVVERADAARRRRRTTIASGLAAAVVVAGVAAVAGGVVGGSPSPEPASPTTPWDGTSAPDDRLPSDVVAILDDDQLQLWSISSSEGGAQAALWRGCDVDPCRYAVVVRDGDDVHGEALGPTFPRVMPVPGGWLVEDARGISHLSPSGDRTEIFETGPGSGDVMAGDTAVSTAEGWRLLRGDKLVPLPPESPAAFVSGAYVTPGGRLVVAGSGQQGPEVVTVGPDGRPTMSTWPGIRRTTVVTGNGDHVARVALGDAADGSIPVLDVEVSHDAGRTWIGAVDLDTAGGDRVRNMSSFAVAADGTAYLTTESHHLLRIDDEGFVTPIQLSASDSAVFAAGAGVCVVVERGRYDAEVCSPDGLTEWADQPLPGLG